RSGTPMPMWSMNAVRGIGHLPFVARAQSLRLPAKRENEALHADEAVARFEVQQRGAQIRFETIGLVSQHTARRDRRGEHQADDRVARPHLLEGPHVVLDLEAGSAQRSSGFTPSIDDRVE